MKFRFFVALSAVISFFLVSCGNDLSSDMVKEIQPTADKITLKADTFHITTQTVEAPRIISRPDSFLLGTFVDKVYGTTQADVLTQLFYPDKYRYMNPAIAETKADSAILTLGFYGNNYFGNVNSPLEIKVYELKKLLTKDKSYSDINPDDYTDYSKLWGYHVTPISQADTYTYSNGIVYKKFRIKMSDEFLARFYNNGNDNIYQSKEAFLDFFKGLYITTKFGSSTLINLTQIELNLFTHYKFKSDGAVVSPPPLRFPVTSEIISVNHIQHPNRKPELIAANSDISYVSSPANYYTQFTIPIDRMRKRISVGDKNLVVNSAILRLDLFDPATMGTSLRYNSTMLLLKGGKEDVETFFAKNSTVDNVNSFIVKLDRENVTSTTYNYFYKFEGLAKLMQTEIARKTNPLNELNMVLVPVKLVLDSNTGAITQIVPDYSMGAAAFNSGKNKANPLKLEVVYSGF